MPTGAGKSAGRVSVRVVPDTGAFRTELQGMLARIERKLTVKVTATLDDEGLKARLERLQHTKVELRVGVNSKVAAAELRRVSATGPPRSTRRSTRPPWRAWRHARPAVRRAGADRPRPEPRPEPVQPRPVPAEAGAHLAGRGEHRRGRAVVDRGLVTLGAGLAQVAGAG